MHRPILHVKSLGFPWDALDPFLFCVHHDDHYPKANDRQGPAASLAGRSIGQDFEGRDGWRMYHGTEVPGFPQHPHRGFETITVVRRGLIDHSDSLGAAARYGHGDVQWLTAGSGILHAEMFPLLDRAAPNPAELFQIWLNLPRADKLAPPHFSMFWKDAIPRTLLHDAEGRETELTLVAGSYGALQAPPPPPRSWAAHADADIAVWTLRFATGAKWVLPAAKPGSHRRLYFFRGATLILAGQTVAAGQAIDLQPDVEVAIENGAAESEVLLLQGRPIGEPVVQHGPFVMTTREEIYDTIRDYQRTQFGGWPWPSQEPVHPRDEGRFARHADGRTERPSDAAELPGR